MTVDKKLLDFLGYLSSIVNDSFRLTSGEESAQREFEKLSYETYLYFKDDTTVYFPPKMESAEYVLKREDLPQELRDKWLNWQTVFKGVLERNPKLELYYMLEDMSETDTSSSWFPDSTMESQILDWVESNVYEPMPVQDRWNIVTPDFYKRLQELRRKCGGWLFPTHVTNHIIFVADKDLSYLRWHKDANGRYQSPKYWEFAYKK